MRSDEPIGEWSPDLHLVERVRSCGADITGATPRERADRAWLVLELTRLGWTAQDMADRMQCSLRLVWKIRDSEAILIAQYAYSIWRKALTQISLMRIDLLDANHRADTATAQVVELRKQRDSLLEQLKLERRMTAKRDAELFAAKMNGTTTEPLCPRCGDSLVAEIPPDQAAANVERGAHPFCAWATESDWRAVSKLVRPGEFFEMGGM